MPRLDKALQRPLTNVFHRILQDARETARPQKTGPSEVDFIENFHALVAGNLESEVRAQVSGIGLSVRVDSALVHGGSAVFNVRPQWPGANGPGVEIGDLLVVAERYVGQLDEAPDERQALLLQVKVHPPKMKPLGTNSTANQAALYSHWPPFDWSTAALRSLPGSFPRMPNPGPCDAAQFAIIDPSSVTFEAIPLELRGGVASFGNPRDLADQLARTVRLDLGVDATPDGGNGWPRIVQDMLAIAPLKSFREAAKTPAVNPVTQDHRAAGASRGRFVVLRIAIADQGILD